MKNWTRRDVIKSGFSAAALAATAQAAVTSASLQPDASAEGQSTGPYFTERGYYITFMRSPLFTFETWKRILDEVPSHRRNSPLRGSTTQSTRTLKITSPDC
jgi:hypothetical protein